MAASTAHSSPITPNFFLAGVVKGGTTSLGHYLNNHPEVYLSPIKETTFLSQRDMDFARFRKDYRMDVQLDVSRYVRGPMTERIHIAHVEAWEDYLRLFAPAKGFRAIGEASVSYAICPSAAPAIHARLPQARIVLMLRDPVSRCFSQYLMNRKEGKTLETDFLREVRNDQEQAHHGWGVSHQYLELGMYADQVARFQQLFPKEQLCLLDYHDFRKDPADTLRQIFAFLGVDTAVAVDTSERLNEAQMPRFARLQYALTQAGVVGMVKRMLPRNARKVVMKRLYSKQSLPALTPEQRAFLIDHYREDVARLETLWNKDLSHWLQPD
ncbi:MAG: sulfotransferase [Bacteroidota bacterium]